MELHRAGREYLKTILMLEQQNGTVRSLDVARALHVTKPSVSKAMKHLREDGYLIMDGDKRIRLTTAGREAAIQAADRHQILKTCLIAMGVDPAAAERDASKMVHDIDPETLERIRFFVETKGRLQKQRAAESRNVKPPASGWR